MYQKMPGLAKDLKIRNRKVMKYWIIIDSWNLMETFTTESLSPHSFYENRSFGTDLTRYISKDGELYNNLVLYRKEPVADYAIEIDSQIIDESLIRKVKRTDAFLYPKTIYYRKGSVRFRFKDEASIRGFIAESKIIFEVKSIEKYSDSFFVDDENAIETGKIDKSESFSFELNDYLYADNIFNSVKGGVVSYACGEKTTTSIENQSLFLALTSLKNMIAGLNTTVMMGEERIIDYSPYKISLVRARNEFLKSEFKSNSNLFEVLKHILDEIMSLSSLRLEVVARQKTPDYAREMLELEKKKEEYKTLLYNLEESNIRDFKEELKTIKDLEVLNGEREGKKRKFFPKGSPEYLRKQELKAQIDKYKEENLEYKNAYREYKAIESSLANSIVGVTQYDSAISALFVRFSDNINDIFRIIKCNLRQGNNNINILPSITIHGNTVSIGIDSATKEEEILYNIFLNYIIANPNGKQNAISERKIIEIVEVTGKLFAEHEASKSENGELILSTLRDFWLYKNQKADSFDIPEQLPVIQAIMSFLIKPRGYDQIERFMLNRGYQMKKYAYLLWGSLIGYAAIPKTLTNMLNDSSHEKVLDEYLAQIYGAITRSYKKVD